MPAGLCIKLYTAEDSEKAEEILVFEKCRRTALMHFHRQQIVLFLNIGCQIEFRGSKAVLGISHEMPVQPDIHRLFHTFETDDHPLSPQTICQMKTLAITSYGIILRLTESTFCQTFSQCVGRAAVDFPLPGIHGVDIMNFVVTG